MPGKTVQDWVSPAALLSRFQSVLGLLAGPRVVLGSALPRTTGYNWIRFCSLHQNWKNHGAVRCEGAVPEHVREVEGAFPHVALEACRPGADSHTTRRVRDPRNGGRTTGPPKTPARSHCRRRRRRRESTPSPASFPTSWGSRGICAITRSISDRTGCGVGSRPTRSFRMWANPGSYRADQNSYDSVH
jgi:hypothetical protein